jgi:hypothetical protein
MIPETPSMSDMISTRIERMISKKKTHGRAAGFGKNA